MDTAKPTILVTGVSGNLGRRLLPNSFPDTRWWASTSRPPLILSRGPLCPLDLGKEESTRQLHLLLRDLQPVSVVHLAFVIDPQRTGVLDIDRMWQINVAGTARVMEAITEANRIAAGPNAMVRQFIFPSSVSAYGSDLPAARIGRRAPAGAHAALCNSQEGKATWSCSTARLRSAAAASSSSSRTSLPEPPSRIT